MTTEQIEDNLRLISGTLDAVVDPLDINSVQRKLNDLAAFMGLSAECTKWAKHILLKRQQEVIVNNTVELPASILSKYIESKCAYEVSLLIWCERVNAGISHTIDALRSIVSLYKTEMQNTLNG